MKRFAKPIAALVVFSLLAPGIKPLVAFADNHLVDPSGQGSISTALFDGGGVVAVGDFSADVSTLEPTQAGKVQNNTAFDSSTKNAAGSLAQAGGTCVFGSMLSELLTTFINYLLESLISDKVTELPTRLTSVPTFDSVTHGNLKPQRAKEVCAWAPYGFCILPSLDSIAFCFINQIIDYIGKATVEWIKTGFKGSPAFIEDPEKFFSNAVDLAAGNLLNQLTDGLLCEPWKAQIQVKLLNEHTGSFQSNAKCSLSEISDKWESFANGDSSAFSWDLQYAYSQNPYNNPVGSTIEARNEFNIKLANTQNGLQVQAGWNNGWLQVKDPETGRITTPGRVIESQLNRRLGNAENRLLVADEFDEIINTLVNQLVKMALSELLDGDSKSESVDGSLTAEYTITTSGGSDDGDTGDTGDTGDAGDTGETLDPDGGTDGIGSDLQVSCVVSSADIDEGETVTATVTATGIVGNPYFDWNGDASQTSSGNTSTGTYVYTQEGNYYPRVRVSDDDWDGQSELLECPKVSVHEDYAVSCTVDDASITRGQRVTYTSRVVGADGAIVSRDWGGATSGLGESISKTYGTAGTYSVHVEIADEEGNRKQVDCPTVTVTN